MADDFKVIATTAIAEITTVRFYAETVEHIKENHPEVPIELPCVLGAVEKAIQNPTTVKPSRNDSYVYVDTTSTDHGGGALHVPVKRIEGTSGLVKTAFFASTDTEEES